MFTLNKIKKKKKILNSDWLGEMSQSDNQLELC